MADIAGGEQELGEEPESAPEVEEDITLSTLFNQDGDDEAPEVEKEVVEESKAAAPVITPPADDRYSLLESKLAEINDKLVEANTANNIFRMQLESRGREAAPEVDDSTDIDVEALNKAIQENPAKAIIDILNKSLTKVQRNVETTATQRVMGVNNQQRMFDQDRNRATTEFGEYVKGDKDFVRRAEEIYAELTTNAPQVDQHGNKWSPGAIYAAMSATYGEFARQGKLKVGKGPLLTERKKAPISSMLGESSGNGAEGGGVLASYNTREIAVMKRTASKLGIPFDSYVKRLEKLKKSDSSYGG